MEIFKNKSLDELVTEYDKYRDIPFYNRTLHYEMLLYIEIQKRKKLIKYMETLNINSINKN